MKQGIDVNTNDELGMTSLHHAAMSSNENMVELLVKNKVLHLDIHIALISIIACAHHNRLLTIHR